VLPADSLLSAAAEYLRLVAACPSVVVVEITGPGDKRFTVHGAPPPPSPAEAPTLPAPHNGPPPALPPGARWLSPAERAILGACGPDWRPRDEIGRRSGALDLVSRVDFDALLRNLVEVGALEGGARGFRLPAGQSSAPL
jgi:hypothetical protein